MPAEPFFNPRALFKDKRKLTVFLICLMVALGSWMLISLGKRYNSTVLIPVKYVNFPVNKILVNQVPEVLAVGVTGSGFDLLKLERKKSEDTLLINLDDLKVNDMGLFQRGTLDHQQLGKELQQRLGGALAINRVLSDSIEFVFDLKVARTIKVKPRASYTIQKGFVQIDSIYAQPAEIEVIGALSILDTLQFINTDTAVLGEINKSASSPISIALPPHGQNFEPIPDEVMLHIEVDQLTERSFMIKPELRNVPDSLQMLTFPNVIQVTTQVPLSRYEMIDEDDFVIYIDFNAMEKGFMVLPVVPESWPLMAGELSLKPDKVEIVLSELP